VSVLALGGAAVLGGLMPWRRKITRWLAGLIEWEGNGRRLTVGSPTGLAVTGAIGVLALSVWGGIGGIGSAGGVVSAATGPPSTPIVSVVVVSDTSAIVISSAFNGVGADTHLRSLFQIDTITGTWATPKWLDTTGAVLRDTAYTGIDSGGVYKTRVKHEATTGGWGSYSDSVTFTAV